jgi:hypothetical protein
VTRSETFRDLARYLNADLRDIDDDSMFQVAATHMSKDNRRKVVALLKDFETGVVSYADIDKFWIGSGARFYIRGEQGVRDLLYRARLILDQSFEFTDIEDLRAGIRRKKHVIATQLSASDNRTFLRLARYFAEICSLDPDLYIDYRKLFLRRMTPEDRGGLEKLVVSVAPGKVTEELLQSRWKASGGSPLPERLTVLVFSAARIIEAAEAVKN